MFQLLDCSPQLSFQSWMPCSNIACMWSVTVVHRTHSMQLPPEDASLNWWSAHLHETACVQSPGKGAISMAKMQAFPMSDTPLLQLCCLAGNKAAGGPSAKAAGLWLLWTTLLSIALSLRSWRGLQRLLLAVSHGWLFCHALRYPRMGADSSQNAIRGWWCNLQCAMLWHVTGMNYISGRSIHWNF